MRTTTSHRTQVLTTGPATVVGICSCGWVGIDRRDPAAAKVDANKHAVDELRSAAKEDTKKA